MIIQFDSRSRYDLVQYLHPEIIMRPKSRRRADDVGQMYMLVIWSISP